MCAGVPTLKTSHDFRRIAQTGQKWVTPAFIMQISRNDGTGFRLGLTVSRKVGGAVVRNRVKRRLREWFRRSKDRFEPASETVVIARASAAGASYHELAAELGRLLEPGRRRG